MKITCCNPKCGSVNWFEDGVTELVYFCCERCGTENFQEWKDNELSWGFKLPPDDYENEYQKIYKELEFLKIEVEKLRTEFEGEHGA